MVETRRSSASSKRPPPSPPPTRSDSKRPKGIPQAEAAGPADGEACVQEEERAEPKEPAGITDAVPSASPNLPNEPAEPAVTADDDPSQDAAPVRGADAVLLPGGCTSMKAEQLVKPLARVDLAKKRVGNSRKVAWGKLLSQSSQNPHQPMYGSTFTVGQSKTCDLCLKDPNISTVLCRLKQTEHEGAFVASLEISGSKGVVQVNGKAIEKNSNVILTGGDEVVFSSSGNHSYIFRQLPTEKRALLHMYHHHDSVDNTIKGYT